MKTIQQQRKEIISWMFKGIPNGKTIPVFEDLVDDLIATAEKRERRKVVEMIDGRKEVYKKGDERFHPQAEDGSEKAHVDSCCNETLDDLINQLNK